MGSERHGNSDGRGPVHINDGVPDHFIRPVTAGTIPQSLVFVGCAAHAESLPDGVHDRQTFRLGVATGVRREKGKWTRRDTLRFTDTFDFWDWLVARLNPKRPLWVFSADLRCESTWLGVWERVDAGQFKINVPCPVCGGFDKTYAHRHTPFRGAAIVSDPPIILCFRTVRGVVKMVDASNYWKTTVHKLGQGIGYPRIQVRGENADDEILFQVCETDVEIIKQSVCALLDGWERAESGHFQSTAAGLAWSAFRKTVEPKQILIDHGEPHTSMERAAYYGGQAEAFYVGQVLEPVHLLDVRSLYPAMMAHYRYPVQFLGMGKDLDPKKVLDRMQFDACIAKVILRTSADGYPYRIKGGIRQIGLTADRTISGRLKFEPDRLAFPTGRYGTTLAGPELLRAIRTADIQEIVGIAWYRSASIFRPFVEEWFARRPAEITPATYAQDLLCKTVLNSLSGYFGKHKMRWKDRPDMRALHPWGEWRSIHAQTGVVTRLRSIGGAVQELEAGGESRDSFPAIPAYITSYGREHMLWLRHRCPERSVYYQDTDSLVVSNRGYVQLDNQGLVGTGELGKLRELCVLWDLKINGIRDYEHARGRKIAGVKEAAQQLGPALYRQELWESLSEQWSRVPDGSVKTRWECLYLSRDRVPRKVEPDGWTTAPVVDIVTEVPF